MEEPIVERAAANMPKLKSSDAFWLAKRTQFTDLPPELVKPLHNTDYIVRCYLAGVGFIVHDAARDQDFKTTHLLSYLAQDYIESAISIIVLAMEGVHNVARRELRFLIEASIKICFIQQKSYKSLIEEKLKEFDRELSSQRISMKQNLLLSLLPENLRDDFCDEVGRVYGLTSNYVHLTPTQIEERIAAVDAGRTAARVNADDIKALNELLSRGLACSLVLLFHSVPSWVAGDWLVDGDGSSNEWYFGRSRFVAGMDSEFDYKAERSKRLSEIQAKRQREIAF
jgi:hypothetical protein